MGSLFHANWYFSKTRGSAWVRLVGCFFCAGMAVYTRDAVKKDGSLVSL